MFFNIYSVVNQHGDLQPFLFLSYICSNMYIIVVVQKHSFFPFETYAVASRLISCLQFVLQKKSDVFEMSCSCILLTISTLHHIIHALYI
jgi:hypothetical protein